MTIFDPGFIANATYGLILIPLAVASVVAIETGSRFTLITAITVGLLMFS